MDDTEVPICDICFVSKLLMSHLLCSAHLCRDCLELSPNCPECFARNFDSQWAQLGQGGARSVGKRKKFRKEEAVAKNKKLKTIEDSLEELTQSVVESQKQESKLKLKLGLLEGYCVYEKLAMDKKQQMEKENLLNSHTLESQKLNYQQKLKIEKLQDEQMDLKKHIMKTKSNIKCLNQELLNFRSCPECPICFDSFQPPKKIVQCVNGHALCLDCSQKPQVKNCPTCREGLTDRATAYEQLLGQMFGTEEGMEG